MSYQTRTVCRRISHPLPLPITPHPNPLSKLWRGGFLGFGRFFRSSLLQDGPTETGKQKPPGSPTVQVAVLQVTSAVDQAAARHRRVFSPDHGKRHINMAAYWFVIRHSIP